jgi:hypothetical protein
LCRERHRPSGIRVFEITETLGKKQSSTLPQERDARTHISCYWTFTVTVVMLRPYWSLA